MYPSQTLEKRLTAVELHSNYSFYRKTDTLLGKASKTQPIHATIEITHGFTEYFELGFYLFNTISAHGNFNYVGSHLRPRVSAPEKWHLPVGLSLSTEVGYMKPEFAEDDWTLEVRPIIDKKIHKFYMAFNPVLERVFHGLNKYKGFTFSPDARVSYAITTSFSAGIEYYGVMGSLNQFDSFQKQEHQFFIAIDKDFSEQWELNAGCGIGCTEVSNYPVVKIILGRKF